MLWQVHVARPGHTDRIVVADGIAFGFAVLHQKLLFGLLHRLVELVERFGDVPALGAHMPWECAVL